MTSLRSGSKLALIAATALLVAACEKNEKPASSAPSVPEVVETAPAPVAPAPKTEAEMKIEEFGLGNPDGLEGYSGDRIYFAYDSSELSTDARDLLAKQAKWLAAYPSVRISVEGHCDERGTREYNLALGERRASAVKNYLTALGVASYRVKTISYGKERPAVGGSGNSAWSQNRRGVTVIQ